MSTAHPSLAAYLLVCNDIISPHLYAVLVQLSSPGQGRMSITQAQQQQHPMLTEPLSAVWDHGAQQQQQQQQRRQQQQENLLSVVGILHRQRCQHSHRSGHNASSSSRTIKQQFLRQWFFKNVWHLRQTCCPAPTAALHTTAAAAGSSSACRSGSSWQQ